MSKIGDCAGAWRDKYDALLAAARAAEKALRTLIDEATLWHDPTFAVLSVPDIEQILARLREHTDER